jgi:Tfp pilus assembly PilM family ATPase
VGCVETPAQPDLLRHPGRFAVACGLALTGIKQAVLPINLLSAEQRGVLSRVTHLMRSRSPRSAWGIDIGGSGLKAVKLAWDEGKQRAVVEATALIEHAKPLSHAANEAEERRLIKETLEAFVNGRKTKPEHLCVGLPGRMALCRPIELPPIEAARVPKFLQFEAAYQFPVPLQQLAWDFQMFDGVPPAADGAAAPNKESRRGLLIGVKHAATRRFLDGFHGLGMRVEVLQTDFVGLHNFLAYEHFPPPGEAPAGKACPVVAALDVGCDVTNIVVGSPYALWYHSGGVAGQSFTRALVKEFNLGIAQAEQRKRAPESAGRLSNLYEAMSPVFEDLLRDVQGALAAYAEAEPNRPIQHILGLGGGFLLHGLFRYLRCGR